MIFIIGFIFGFLMGLFYYVFLRIRVSFIFKSKIVYYLGWILSMSVFAILFLVLHKHIQFDVLGFLTGVLVAQISVLSYSFINLR